MPPTGAPIQELPITTTENGIKSIYAFHIDLKQLDLGYELPKEGRPLAPHHLHVYADTVEIGDRLVLPGKNVGIFARKVKLTKSASIDVAGATAKDNYKPADLPQQKDMNRGAKGSPGANGSSGEAAGNVTIIADELVGAADVPFGTPLLKNLTLAELDRELKGGAPNLVIFAQGGTGGRGQDGHPGMEGAKGENGRQTSAYIVMDPGGRYKTPPETAGQKGKTGGQGGDAGHSGNGGAGGVIVLNFMKAAPVSILLTADAGAGGAQAAPGARGRGGEGGDGAEFYVHVYNSNEVELEAGPDGPRGDEGPVASFQGNHGNAGTAGKVEANGAKVESTGPKTLPAYSYDKMALSMKLDQLLMVQRIGKLTFLNADSDADYQLAASLFLWLCNVCPDSVTKANNALTVQDRNARAAICSSARVEMLRIQRGLDYFGHPYNWAPVLSLRHNQKRVTELIGLGKIVEQQLDIYNDTNKSVAEKLAALNATVAELTRDLAKTENANAVLQKEIEAGENACTSLQKDIENQVAVMRRGQAAIEDEIRKKVDDQCNLENVINVTKALVTVGSGAFDVVGAIKGGKELLDIFDEAKKAAATIGQAKDVIEKIQKTVGDLNSLGKQLSTVTAAVKAGKPDSVKIAVLRDEFEENIKPLIKKFPNQSKELRTAVRAFFDLNQARNEKILAYNALFVQKAELKALSEQLHAHIQSVQTIISENKQALVPVAYTSFFRSALGWSKQNLIHLLYEGSRAFYYHTGTQRKDLMEKLSDLNVAALADTQAKLLTAYDDYLRSVGRPYGPFTDIKVTISREDDPALFEGLPTTGRITFKIDHTHPEFEGLTLVKVDSVAVALPGIKGGKTDVLNVAMTMAGEGAVRPVDNNDEKGVVHFNCPPRPISFRYGYDPDRRDPIIEPGIIADKEFSALSPFTTWTLDFGLKNNLNKFLKLADVKTIDLHFNGHAFGRRALRSKPT